MKGIASQIREAARRVVEVVGAPGRDGSDPVPSGGSTGGTPAPPGAAGVVHQTPAAPLNEVPTPHGAVRVVPARWKIPGTDQYPGAPPGPRVPARKKPVAREELGYYPRWHVPEHPVRWGFPGYLDNPSCRWLQTLKKMYGMPIAFPASLAPESGLLVHALVRNLRPRVVVETGTFIGMSTVWMAAALAENGDGGVVHTFDDFGPIRPGPWREVEMQSGRLEFVAGLIAEAGLAERVVLHPGNSPFEIRAAQGELKAAGGVQLAFLDADHGIPGVWQDFWATEPVLETGGFVLLHDTFPEYCGYDGPRHLLDHVNEKAVGVYEKVDLYLAPMNYGLGLIRRVG